MNLIKNVELIEEVIGGFIYGFDYDIIMFSFTIKIQKIIHEETSIRKLYEMKLEFIGDMEYNVLDKEFGVAKIEKIEISKYKHQEFVGDYMYEEDLHNIKIKIWGDELSIKCRNIIINLITEKK